MKLFVWADPYPIEYGTWGLFVVAETIDEAKELARKAPTYRYVQFEQNRGKPIPDLSFLGEPTRVVDLPCAEWHEWQE